MVFTTPQRAASLSSYSPFPLMPTRRKWWSVRHTPQRSPRHADCRGGGFATRRFPRPLPIIRANHTRIPYGFYNNDAARRVVIRLHVSHLWGPMVFITPRHGGHSQEGRVLMGGRATRGPPLRHLPTKRAISQSRQLIEMRFPAANLT